MRDPQRRTTQKSNSQNTVNPRDQAGRAEEGEESTDLFIISQKPYPLVCN